MLPACSLVLLLPVVVTAVDNAICCLVAFPIVPSLDDE
jgi:hypothetical protein